MDLADIEGLDPCQKMDEYMTHELLLLALSPDLSPTVEPWTWRIMIPINFQAQVALRSHQDALNLAAFLAQRVCDGKLWAEPPLSMQIEPWATTVRQAVAAFDARPQS